MPDVLRRYEYVLYLHDRGNEAKAARAKLWLGTLAHIEAACVNLQVLNEATHVLLRKKWYDAPAIVYRIIDDLAELGDTPVTWAQIALARTLHARLGYSWWDCLLLASALELGCSHFLSEDLQDGQAAGGLTIVDPFAHRPEQILGPQ